MNAIRSYLPLALLAVVVAGAPGCADAQDRAPKVRSISVTGSGEASGVPDQAQVNVGVQTLAATAIDSSNQNQQIVSRIMQALAKHGIDKKHVQTSNYSIWPEQRNDPRNDNQVTITGYRVNNTVNVNVEDIDKIGAVLAAVTTAGANTINGINFGVKDSAALEREARAAAMADARERAEALANLAGVKLGNVLTISMSAGGGQPMPMMRSSRMEMDAASVPGISPGQLSVSVHVNVMYEIE